eukprot:9147397-Alexandrium_andersonii.AAC.1
MAWRRGPNNPNVVATIEKGIPNATEWHWRTPPDVLEFLATYRNGWHEGSGDNFVQLLRNLPTYEAEWAAHATLQGWTARAGDGEK